MFEEKDDTILARWLAGELTPDELKEFKESEEYTQYMAIVKGLDRFEKPAFDKSSLKERIDNQLAEKPTEPKVFSIKRIVTLTAIAASILVLFGIFYTEVSYTTATGETLVVTLPDGTNVSINSESTLSHKRFFWKQNRNVSLEGEAFFDVTSGDDFVVTTSYGEVAVLGTEFNIHTRNKHFELACYEGKVQYTNNNTQESTQLTPGKAIEVKSDIITPKNAGPSPAWMLGKSQFNSTPLGEVLEDLQRHYTLTVKTENLEMEQLFTGSFSYDNLDLALRTICLTMGLEYTLSEDNTTVLISRR